MPRRGERRQAFHFDQIRRGNRHRPAEAIADQRNRPSNAAQQRQQQLFDMTRDRKLGALVGLAPIEEKRAAPHAGNRGSERDFFVEVENARRIDQRRHEQSGRPVTAMVAQCCTAHSCDFRLRWGPVPPRRPLIRAQSCERVRCKSGIAFRHLSYQFEKQRERTWRSLGDAFMLQRTMLR